MFSCLVSKGFSCFKLDIGISTHLEFLPVFRWPGLRVRKGIALYFYRNDVSDLFKILLKGGNFRTGLESNYLCPR